MSVLPDSLGRITRGSQLLELRFDALHFAITEINYRRYLDKPNPLHNECRFEIIQTDKKLLRSLYMSLFKCGCDE